MTQVANIINQFDVVSFDAFDTLLLRPLMRPTDLFFKIESDERASGFAEARISAERRANAKAREHGRAEATFDEIYAEIPKWKSMQTKELSAERRCLTANTEMVDIYNAAKSAGKKVVVTSDMYLPGPFLQDVLRNNGIDGWDGFYLSNTCQAQKRTGTLYDVMLADLGVAASQVLHIGDSNQADVAQANQKGIVAYGYQKVCDKFLDECPFVREFLGRKPNLDKRLFVGALATGWHLFKCGHKDWTYWNRIGYLFAGVLGYLYMRMVGEDAKERGIKHLMFVARDGYILQKIFKVLYPGFRTDYFYASREQALLATQYYGRTNIGAMVRREYCKNYLEKNCGVRFSKEESAEYLEHVVLPTEARRVFDDASACARNEAIAYFKQFNIEQSTTAIVDGNSTHLTMQRFVGDIVGGDIFAYYLFTNLPANNAKSLCCTDWDMRYLKFSEFLFGAPTPPLETVKDGKPVFKEDVPFFEKFKVSLSDEICDGALACAKMLNHANVTLTHDIWLDWNDAFLDNRTSKDDERFSLARDSIAIEHDSGFAPVLSSWASPKYFRLFGRTLLRIDASRRGVVSCRRCMLFGRIKLFEANTRTVLRIWSLLRRR